MLRYTHRKEGMIKETKTERYMKGGRRQREREKSLDFKKKILPLFLFAVPPKTRGFKRIGLYNFPNFF